MFFGLYMHVLHTQYINIQSAGGRDKTEKPERKFTQNIRKRSVQCRADGENEVYEQTLTVPAEKKYLYTFAKYSANVGTNPFYRLGIVSLGCCGSATEADFNCSAVNLWTPFDKKKKQILGRHCAFES